MEYLFEIIIRMISLLLTAYQIALIIRILLEFFIPENEENMLLNFLHIITEPGLILCEKLLSIVSIKNTGPIDITAMVSLIFAAVLKMTLNAII